MLGCKLATLTSFWIKDDGGSDRAERPPPGLSRARAEVQKPAVPRVPARGQQKGPGMFMKEISIKIYLNIFLNIFFFAFMALSCSSSSISMSKFHEILFLLM